MKNKNFSVYLFVLWFALSLFYFIESAVKVSPAVMHAQLIKDLSMNNANVGMYSAIFFLIYSVMQIPAGWILDRYKLTNVVIIAIIIFSFGNYLTSTATCFQDIIIARILISIGSAFSFLSILKFNELYISKNNISLSIGIANFFGIVGSIVASQPLSLWIQKHSWQFFFIINTYLSWIILIIIFIAIKIKPKHQVSKNNIKYHLSSKIILSILSEYKPILIGIYAGIHITPIITFCEMWSPLFLTTMFDIPQTTSANINSLTYLGILIGGPTWGLLDKKQLINKNQYKYLSTIQIIIFTAIIFYPLNNLILISILFFLLGFNSSSILLCYNNVIQIVNPAQCMLYLALVNSYISVPSIIFQKIISSIIPNKIIINITEIQLALIPIIIILTFNFFLSKRI